jgi:GTPase SAR1 family protein
VFENANFDVVLGREAELRRLRSAVQKRTSVLIWGPADAGKTTLVRKAIAEVPEATQKRCICWSGAATGRNLTSYFIRGLYQAGDGTVRKKVHADGASAASLSRWLQNQSLIRLRGILFTAAERGEYRFFIDHLPSVNHATAKVMKELINRCKSPVYLTGTGYSAAEIGFAWSLFWTDEYRIRLGPLPESVARELLEICIRRFRLDSLDLGGFREEILHLSGHLPGAIVKMCELASDSRYHYHDQIKTKVIHVDYLMSMAPPNSWSMNR